jgi:hypothetical protein
MRQNMKDEDMFALKVPSKGTSEASESEQGKPPKDAERAGRRGNAAPPEHQAPVQAR